jgi:hypothetical protein
MKPKNKYIFVVEESITKSAAGKEIPKLVVKYNNKKLGSAGGGVYDITTEIANKLKKIRKYKRESPYWKCK